MALYRQGSPSGSPLLGLVKALGEGAEWRNLREQKAVVLLLCFGTIPGI